MSDPVMAADGHSYERSAIERWLATKSTSPMTGVALVHSFLAPNHTLRRQIREWQHPRLNSPTSSDDCASKSAFGGYRGAA
ncbi:hypothetical protein EMIHUDRAFT_231606 [Emiliania huxleyi CCMP1516]|uniref:U-box domain-containing protein n=2 Tax=Emiliania huxleyi TaxID=2903 RepID=A0A0D3K797_EMIH1|nr:hypothetical protein EMIHUDRAFT_231606 [Emiliania huxleyi CCMP1516]EOD31632.1 hypothetical protein EMIHUDRAFT_231606 [Emiliania huxleyi CCMP1516]|eukprot:XP_005784061.1 hypothetical protein EMIHUDRAFT_231606 [Emiliania huxleyi CCMP1516]